MLPPFDLNRTSRIAALQHAIWFSVPSRPGLLRVPRQQPRTDPLAARPAVPPGLLGAVRFLWSRRGGFLGIGAARYHAPGCIP